MNPSTSLAALLCADVPTLLHLRNSIDELIAARNQPGAVKVPEVSPVKVAKSQPVKAPNSLCTLEPMRPPRPGSLRSDIYAVLSMKPSMTRAEIIAALARIRPDAHKRHFVSKIHDTLNRVHDHAIERVGRGVYRLVTK